MNKRLFEDHINKDQVLHDVHTIATNSMHPDIGSAGPPKKRCQIIARMTEDWAADSESE